MTAPRFRIPLALIALDFIGVLLAGTGFWGLIDPQAGVRFAPLASTPVAALLLVIGIALMAWAVVGILARARAAARAARATTQVDVGRF